MKLRCNRCGRNVNTLIKWKCAQYAIPFKRKSFLKARRNIQLYFSLDNRRSFTNQNEVNFKL